MNEQPPPPLPDSCEPASTLFERLTNVFVAPGEVMEGLRSSKRCHANWLVPLILSIITAMVFVCVAFSQDAVIHELRDAPEKAIQKQIDSGKMSKEEGQKAIDMIERIMSPTLFRILGAFGALVAQATMTFGGALVIWLIGTKYFKAEFGYWQALEAVGMATMITLVGALIQTFLVVIKGSMLATAGPALLVGELSATNPTHLALAALNVPELWFLTVVTIGLARLGGTTFGKAAVWVFAIWGLLRLGPVISAVMRRV